MTNTDASVREPWWREWPLALAVATLTLAMLGKGSIATALDQPAMLIALLAIICSVILAAAIAIVRHADVLAHGWVSPRARYCSRSPLPGWKWRWSGS